MASEGKGIMVFRPSRSEFTNFSAFIHKMESQGAHKAGAAKIIPPKGWIPRKNYDNVDTEIPAPILQLVTGTQGLFQLFNVQKKQISFKEFKNMANSERYKPPKGDFDELERKYWKNVTFNAPIYGADISGSIFDKNVNEWNISRLDTILDLIDSEYGVKLEGVNTPYLYYGMWKATFAWHTEDMDLYSINYIHFGAPKTWYVVPPEHGQRLERLAAGFFPGSHQNCPDFLRHKMTIISPQVLKKFSIPFDKITQEAGEFMITFPCGYHCGFNHGFNCAESTNFCSERWIDYGRKARVCQCRKDSVKICMDAFVKKYQPEQWEEYLAAKKKDEDLESTSEEESDDSEDSEEEESDEDEEIETNKKTVTKKNGTLKSCIPKRKRSARSNQKVVSTRQAKRQPPVTKSVILPSSKRKVEEPGKDGGAEDKPTGPLVVDVLAGLWHHDEPNFRLERAFNIAMAEISPFCSICQFFSKLKVDPCIHLKERLPKIAESLTKASPDIKNAGVRTRSKSSIPIIPEICFMSEGSSPESMSSWLDTRFTGDTESPLLRCESCRVVVHASCYGIQDVPSNGTWKCNRCVQENDDDALRTTHCSLCILRGGALKKTTDDKWVHIGCAVSIPEVVFEDVGQRAGINTHKIPPGRSKLKCSLCRSFTSGAHGTCVQCCAGKCAVSFHVTCCFLAGNHLEPSDWPQPVETFCDRHRRDKFKAKERDFSEISCGESVIAKHKNGRYYRGTVLGMTSEEFYAVTFDDGSFCDNLPPKDIEGRDSRQGDIPEGTLVLVNWKDGEELYRARVNGRRICVTYQITFEDESCFGVRREDVYKESEELPKRVGQRLSSATETANLSYWEDIPREGAKRRRKENPRYGMTYVH